MGGTVTARDRGGIGRGGLPRWCRDDRGSGTVVGLVLIAAAVLFAVWLTLLIQAQTARGRAQTAADLAALAGATAARNGTGTECAVVAEVISHNRAQLTACVVEGGGVVRVDAAVACAVGDATAWARAGPVEARYRE